MRNPIPERLRLAACLVTGLVFGGGVGAAAGYPGMGLGIGIALGAVGHELMKPQGGP